jgi:DUF1680 family protein
LQQNAYELLPLTSIKPTGWLKQQLQIQANGLTGHLDEFWPSVGPDSGWLGGKGESWERGPYYADGLVPLAFLLDDPKLVAKAKKWVEWTLANQRPDGSIGPEKNMDWWATMVMLKTLTQYQEATGDPRVIPLMQRYFRHHLAESGNRPLQKWAVFRWQDEALTVLWLYNRTGDTWLLDLAKVLRKQGHDWRAQFENFQFTAKTEKKQAGLPSHIVNNAMALKTAPLAWLVSGDATDRGAFYQQLEQMDRYHLLPSGVHSGDEHLAGLNPSQGTELCAVVEGMFSIEQALAILGDAKLGDRLEKISYNALPGTFTGDMWAHQYDQQPNQVLCNIYPRNWTTNGRESNLFGLEPNFGCCTANMHQGWPKLTASLWMSTPDQGLAAAVYAPNEVTANVHGGVKVRIIEDTEYPFRDTVRFTIQPAGAVEFPLHFRIPAWTTGATLKVNGKVQAGVSPGTFHIVKRTWQAGDRVELKLPMRVTVARGFNDSISVERGPLIYSLKIGEEWKKIRDKSPAADWEVHPTTAWNYGLLLKSGNADKSVQVVEKPIGSMPFTPAGAPVELRVKGRHLPQWGYENGSAATPPKSPVTSSEPLTTLILIPYGSAKLRITAFPALSQ